MRPTFAIIITIIMMMMMRRRRSYFVYFVDINMNLPMQTGQ
jgi:hypothetical protein